VGADLGAELNASPLRFISQGFHRMASNTADKDYYLDRDGKLTTDASKANSLLVRKGMEISPRLADQYGIGGKATTATSNDADTAKGSKPTNTKAKTPSSNK
jgi:hypothetical protein